MNVKPSLDMLINHINISKVPFSDRGSRLLVFSTEGSSRLHIKLAERLTVIQPDIEAYLRRPPFITDLALLDDQGIPLEFSVTSLPHQLTFQTRIGIFQLAFQDERTLSFGLPDGTVSGISFKVSPQFWEQTIQGGNFRSVRNLTYASNGEIFDNVIHPDNGGYRVVLVVKSDGDKAINIAIHPSETSGITDVLPFSTVLHVAETRWEDWFNRVPAVDERYVKMYAYAWWIMANNLISPLGEVVYEAMMPSKIQYVGLWLWDSALHALAYRYIDPQLARNQIRAVIAHQLPNGMLPDATYDEGLVYAINHPISGEVTKPPILAWSVLKLHDTNPDVAFLREVYPSLVRFNAWWFAMNDDDNDGLVQYSHPYSSGLDDSPLWDYGMPVESPDLNTYLCLQMEAFERIADILGLVGESAMWHRRRISLVKRMIHDMWDPEAGLFWALKEEERIPVVTPFNLYPIWTGLLPPEINERIVRHLLNPSEFAGKYIIPTVARNDSHYNSGVMWRGPIWANINYFFIEALEKIGQGELASQVTNRTLEMIAAQPDIYEFYNAETGQPPEKAANIFGWTAAVFIDLAIRASQAAGEQDSDAARVAMAGSD